MPAWTTADAIFEGKVESVELRWKLKEAQIGDTYCNTDLDQDGRNPGLVERYCTPIAVISGSLCGLILASVQPLLAYTADAATSGSFVFNQILPGEYWAIVAVDASVESKWSTRKAGVEVVGDITHLSLELIAN